MKKLNLDDAERNLLDEMMALSTDDQGSEIFVGLNVAESEWLVQYRQDTRSDEGRQRRRDHREKHWSLYEKHERARVRVVLADSELRTFKPTQN